MAAFTTRPELTGTFGAAAASHWLGASTAMSVLERGGNAFDAAAACGFVLQIVEPHLNGPGGDSAIIVKAAGEANPAVICGQGVAPAAADIRTFKSLGLDMVPGTGLLPAVVPGCFDAWMLMLRDYGSLPLADILQYAIGYATKGFPLLPRAVSAISPAKRLFLEDWPSSGAVWLPNGTVPKPGALFTTPQIAQTYRRILDEAAAAGGDRVAQIEAARRAFYQGFVAEAVDRFYRGPEIVDTSGRRHRGLLAGDDLARWRANKEPTVSRDFFGVTVHKTGPWGQGPVLLQQLALLANFDLAGMDPLGDDFVHTVIECAKLAFADREVFYGDSDASEIPLATLLSDDYAARRARLVGEAASLALRPSDLPGASERLATILARAGSEQPLELGGGEVTFAALPEIEGDTVHLDVVDRFGNMVSATPSGGWLQSSPVVPGLGFPLSTRGQMFWLDEGLPSSLRPLTRPRTTLTPTLITKDGAPYMAMGTPGGDQQDQWQVPALLRHLVGRRPMQETIDAPMFHSRHWPSSFYPRAAEPGKLLIEDRFDPAIIRRLEARGHIVERQDGWSLGRICAVRMDRGLLSAAATPRHMQSYAVVR